MSLAIKSPERFTFLNQLLKGISQIMLQENPLTGVLFLTGLFIGSWQCGLAALFASATGTLTAKLLRFDPKNINTGFYGFSSALVGVVLVFLFQSSMLIWLLVLSGSSLAAIIQHLFSLQRVPVFTFPFILVAWLFVFLLNRITETQPSVFATVKLVASPYNHFFVMTKSFGQVIFQGSLISGMLFFMGVLISNPVAALYGLGAAIIASLLSQWNGQPLEQIHLGLFGFNAVLTAIVFAGTKRSNAFWVLAGVLLTVLVNNLLVTYSILDIFGGVFTFPFVAGTWLTLLIKKAIPLKKVGKDGNPNSN